MAVEQILVTSLLYMACKKFIYDKHGLKGALFIFVIYVYYLISNSLDLNQNVYSQLDLSRSLTSEEIRESYKKTLRSIHPDKNPSPNAENEFRELKALYDYIKTNEARIQYEKYGKSNKVEAVGSAIGFYIGWIFVANGLYFGKISNAGRNLLCLICGLGVLESVVFPEILRYSIYWRGYTIHEIVQIFKTLMPALCFLINSLEYLRLQKHEKEFEEKYNSLLHKRWDLINKIRTKESPYDLVHYLRTLKDHYKNRYSANWKDYIPYIVIFYILNR